MLIISLYTVMYFIASKSTRIKYNRKFNQLEDMSLMMLAYHVSMMVAYHVFIMLAYHVSMMLAYHVSMMLHVAYHVSLM